MTRSSLAWLACLVLRAANANADAADPRTDLRKFLQQREECDHWRGEDGYDPQRQAEIAWGVCQTCPGTDADLARLKKKFGNDPKVLQTLEALEPEIEPKDKVGGWAYCKGTSKPPSLR